MFIIAPDYNFLPLFLFDYASSLLFCYELDPKFLVQKLKFQKYTFPLRKSVYVYYETYSKQTNI